MIKSNMSPMEGPESDVTWPKVFSEPNYTYDPTELGERKALLDGLVGWGNCHSQHFPPNGWQGFGEGMVVIGDRLGISATSENILAYSLKTAFPPKKKRSWLYWLYQLFLYPCSYTKPSH